MKKGLIIFLAVCLFGVSMSCSANTRNPKSIRASNNNQTISEEEKKAASVESEASIKANAEVKVQDVQVSSAKTLGLKDKKFEDILGYSNIEKLHFPLPEKYRYYVSSTQGLRESIPNVNAGGGSTASVYHNAIDFAVPDKTPVYAAKSGYVKTVYPSYYNGEIWKGHPTYGGLIEIAHPDGTTTLYAHLSYTEVREGDLVEAEQEIGWSGGKKGRRGSGNSTGPHLHFSEYIDINNQFM